MFDFQLTTYLKDSEGSSYLPAIMPFKEFIESAEPDSRPSMPKEAFTLALEGIAHFFSKRHSGKQGYGLCAAIKSLLFYALQLSDLQREDVLRTLNTTSIKDRLGEESDGWDRNPRIETKYLLNSTSKTVYSVFLMARFGHNGTHITPRRLNPLFFRQFAHFSNLTNETLVDEFARRIFMVAVNTNDLALIDEFIETLSIEERVYLQEKYIPKLLRKGNTDVYFPLPSNLKDYHLNGIRRDQTEKYMRNFSYFIKLLYSDIKTDLVKRTLEKYYVLIFDVKESTIIPSVEPIAEKLNILSNATQQELVAAIRGEHDFSEYDNKEEYYQRIVSIIESLQDIEMTDLLRFAKNNTLFQQYLLSTM